MNLSKQDSFYVNTPHIEEYNHNELPIIHLAENKGRKVEREFIISLIKKEYKKPSPQIRDLLTRLEQDGYDFEQLT